MNGLCSQLESADSHIIHIHRRRDGHGELGAAGAAGEGAAFNDIQDDEKGMLKSSDIVAGDACAAGVVGFNYTWPSDGEADAGRRPVGGEDVIGGWNRVLKYPRCQWDW